MSFHDIESMMQRDTLAALKATSLFSEFNEKELEVFQRHCTVREVSKGTILFREGDEYRGFYIVLDGSVKIFRTTSDGKETVLHLIHPLHSFAEIPMFIGGPYPAFAEMLEDSSLLFVGKDGFLDHLQRYPEMAIRMLAGLSKRLQTLGAQLERLTALDVKTRLVRFLLEEYRRQSKDTLIPVIELPMTKSLLASYLGTILETLSRTFKKLEDEGLIRVRGKKIFLEDAERMRREYWK